MVHNFRKLNIWLNAVDLVTEIYALTHTFPKIEQFGLISQMQRAAISSSLNIAEGSAKSSEKDFSRFLEMSLGSLFELETTLQIALNLKYMDVENYNVFQHKIIELEKMISGFKSKLNVQ